MRVHLGSMYCCGSTPFDVLHAHHQPLLLQNVVALFQ
jgi:hypothetical protein